MFEVTEAARWVKDTGSQVPEAAGSCERFREREGDGERGGLARRVEGLTEGGTGAGRVAVSVVALEEDEQSSSIISTSSQWLVK